MTKRREFYARAACQLRGHERALRAELECPGAMGMFLFLLLDARGEETDGDVAEIVALSSWGGGGKYRAKQVDALVDAGLVERRDDRLVVVKYGDHNDTPMDIAAARDAAKTRQRVRRSHGSVTRDTRVSHGDVPISISVSSSDSGSDLGSRSDPPTRSGGPPDWWPGAVDAAAMVVGDVTDPEARWLEYVASRERKGWSASHTDAVGWLTAVVRRERRDRVTRNGPSTETPARTAARVDLGSYEP